LLICTSIGKVAINIGEEDTTIDMICSLEKIGDNAVKQNYKNMTPQNTLKKLEQQHPAIKLN